MKKFSSRESWAFDREIDWLVSDRPFKILASTPSLSSFGAQQIEQISALNRVRDAGVYGDVSISLRNASDGIEAFQRARAAYTMVVEPVEADVFEIV